MDTSIRVTNLLDNKHKENGVHYQGMSNEYKASVENMDLTRSCVLYPNNRSPLVVDLSRSSRLFSRIDPRT